VPKHPGGKINEERRLWTLKSQPDAESGLSSDLVIKGLERLQGGDKRVQEFILGSLKGSIQTADEEAGQKYGHVLYRMLDRMQRKNQLRYNGIDDDTVSMVQKVIENVCDSRIYKPIEKPSQLPDGSFKIEAKPA
jgi:hypothetical protein